MRSSSLRLSLTTEKPNVHGSFLCCARLLWSMCSALAAAK
jgi:hypothetical protein